MDCGNPRTANEAADRAEQATDDDYPAYFKGSDGLMRVVLLSGHYFESKRKAGFHWLAQAYRAAGHEVLFVTVGISWLSWIRRDYRFDYPIREEANKIKRTASGIESYVWFTTWHPANLRSRLANTLSAPLFARYGDLSLGDAEDVIRSADILVFESTPAIMLFERLRELNMSARFVYRVSDDIRLLKMHPVVIEAEDRIVNRFDLVSAPSAYIFRRFQRCENARLQLHGLQKKVFDAPTVSPYSGQWAAHAVFAGNSHVDYHLFDVLSSAFPDVCLHLIGPLVRSQVPRRRNVVAYGELPFADTVPFLKHADVGLQARSYSPGAESLSDSLKVIQYTYCQLPIIAPAFLGNGRGNMCYYQPGDDGSIRDAMTSARRLDRRGISREGILTWDELARDLIRSPDRAN